MLNLFQYNWQVRKEWFDWCILLPHEELLRERVGGVGSFLQTLFHIVDAECSYIREIKGLPDLSPKFDDYMSLVELRKLSDHYHEEVSDFLRDWSYVMDQDIVQIT
jgi:uncharacterized damage-inducible protein DinB